MRRNEIQAYVDALNSVSEFKGVKFAFTVLKNKKKIEKQVDEDKEIIQEVLTATDDFKDFEEKRIELCNEHSNKDDKGEAIIIDEKFDLIDEDAFNVAFDSLKVEYADAIGSRESQLKEFDTMMKEEVTIDFVKLNSDELPEGIETYLESIHFMLDLGE